MAIDCVNSSTTSSIVMSDPTFRDELTAAGYLESGVGRFLRRGAGDVRSCLRATFRLALVGGPVVAAGLLGFHVVADPPAFVDPIDGATLGLFLLAGGIMVVFVVGFPAVLVARRFVGRRTPICTAVVAGLVPAIYLAATWWRFRSTLPTGLDRVWGDGLAAVVVGMTFLLLARWIALAGRGRTSFLLRHRGAMFLPVFLAASLLVVVHAVSGRRFEPKDGVRFDVRLTGARLAWITIDGVSPSDLDAAFAAEAMPYLARLAREGGSASLASPHRFRSSAPRWISAATGVRPEGHGIHRLARSRVRWSQRPWRDRFRAILLPMTLSLEMTPLSADQRRVWSVDEIVAEKTFRVVAVNQWCSGPVFAAERNDGEGDGALVVTDRAIRSAMVGRSVNVASEVRTGSATSQVVDELAELARRTPVERRRDVDATSLRLTERLAKTTERAPHLVLVTLVGCDLRRLAGDVSVSPFDDLRGLDRDIERFMSGLGENVAGLVTIASADERHGVAVFSGAPFASGVAGVRFDHVDLAPLVLRVLGFPIAADMAGRVPERALDATFSESHAPAMISSFGERRRDRQTTGLTAERDHLEALRTLGYLR